MKHAPSEHPRSTPRLTGELSLIHLIRHRAARLPRTSELRLGIGDDCAILRPRRGEDLVVTTDFSLETRHFRRDWHPPASIGHRLLARGLSDLAAMGARPIAAFLSLALPRTLTRKSLFLQGMLDGLLALARQTRTPLAGGDTSESPSGHLLADIILLGAVPSNRALRRDTAQPGDRLFVTGCLGGAAAELAQLAAHPRRFAGAAPSHDHPHLFPIPRLTVGQTLLRRHLATAALDLSDGLSTDLRHLCESSNLAATLEATRIPLHPNATLDQALHGGEDYELLFAAPPGARVPRTLAGLPLTQIGTLEARRRGRPLVTLLVSNGRRRPLAPGGWEHLR